MNMRLASQSMAVKLAADLKGFGSAGDTIQLSLAPSDVNIAEEMNNFLAGFSPFDFRADEVAKPFVVDKDTDKFRILSQNNAFQRVNVVTSREAGVRQVDPVSSLDDYQVVERALGFYLSTVTEGQMAYDARKAGSDRIRWALELDREVRVWDLLTTIANWNASQHVAVANPWTDQTLGDPIADLQGVLSRSTQRVDSFWMSVDTSHLFLRHVKVRDQMRQMLGDNPAPSAIQNASGAQTTSMDFQVVGLPPIKICPAKVLNETTGDLDTILTNNAVVGITSTPGLPTSGEEIQTVQTFRRRSKNGGEGGFTSREFFVDERGLEGGSMMVQGHAEDVKFISNSAGGLLTAVNP